MNANRAERRARRTPRATPQPVQSFVDMALDGSIKGRDCSDCDGPARVSVEASGLWLVVEHTTDCAAYDQARATGQLTTRFQA